MISLSKRVLATLKVSDRELGMSCIMTLQDRRNYYNFENIINAHKWGTEIYICIRLGGHEWVQT